MAIVTDYFIKAAPKWTGAIGSGGVADGVTTTVPLSSASGLTNGEAYFWSVVEYDASNNKTVLEVGRGTLSGTDFINCVRGEEGTAQAHDAGATVEILFTAAQWNRLLTGLLVDHDALGQHSDLTDANGNEWVRQTATASAVNDITVANAATGNAPKISATGDDTNVDLLLAAKGTGEVKKRTSMIIQVEEGATTLTTGDGKAYITIPEQLDGMNLSAVHARVLTAPTGAAISIQINNVTGAADMLSTALTIDATETGSDTAATAAVIDTANDDVATNDLIRIDLDQVGSTVAGKGLIVRLEFDLP